MRTSLYVFISVLLFSFTRVTAQVKENVSSKAEHGMINLADDKSSGALHTLHPDARWYPEAGSGVFIHWGLSSINNIHASWPIITCWGLSSIKLDAAEMARVIPERQYNTLLRTGKSFESIYANGTVSN